MVAVTHTFVSGLADVPADALAGKTLPSHWNASHTVSGISGTAGQVALFTSTDVLGGNSDFRWISNVLHLGSVGGASIRFNDTTVDPAHPYGQIEQVAGATALRFLWHDDDGIGPVALIGVGGWVDASDYNGWSLSSNGDTNLLVSVVNGGTQEEIPWKIGTSSNFFSLWTVDTNPIDAFDAIGISISNNVNRYLFSIGAFYPQTDIDVADLGTVDDPWRAVYGAPVPPTSDPLIAGAFWNNSGTLTISAGPPP